MHAPDRRTPDNGSGRDATPQLDHLRVLVAVADGGSFAAAARQLERSPAAISRTIAALEKSLGVRLVERTTRALHFTPTGERLLARARGILANLEEAVAEASSAQAALSGQIGVTAPLMFGRLHLAPLLLAFMERHPRVQVRLVLADRTLSLVEAGLAVAVRIGELPDSGLRAVSVGHLRRVLVAAPAYLRQYGELRTLADLASHRAIGFAQDVPLSRWRFKHPGRGILETVQPSAALVVNDQAVRVDAAIRGYGLATALSYQVREPLAAGQLRRVLEDYEPPPVPVHVVYTGGERAPARVRALVDFVAERLRANPVLREA